MNYDIVLINDQCHGLADEYIYLNNIQARDNEYDLSSICSMVENRDMAGIVVCNDYFVVLAEQIAERIGSNLVNIGVNKAKLIRDKFALKRELAKHNIKQPKFASFADLACYNDIITNLGSPFIVKPKSEALGMGISVINSEEDYALWYKRKNQEIKNYYLEEYITDMKEYCCDTLMADGKNIAQFTCEYNVSCLTANILKAGYGVVFPGFSTSEEIAELKRYADEIIIKLGINSGFCHMEFFRKDNKWLFSEIGYRIPGGYQIPTESYMADTSVMELYLKTMLRTEITPQDRIQDNESYYGWFFYPKQSGKIKKINTQLDYQWVVEKNVLVQEGDVVEISENYSSISAVVVYRANSKEDLKNKSERIGECVKIIYE
ncbi:MAG: ATP-grasp domain-containing protein [bacterium]